jgi:hypothetical protein
MPRQFGKRDESVGWARCEKCGHRHKPDADCPAIPATGVTYLIRPMPDGQWPLDDRAPRDDSFGWLVRSHCGHPSGAKLWAFYREADAKQYEQIFRANPCFFTRCPRFKIQNEERLSRG